MTMTANSTVRVPTTKASRYLQQLCKHFGHKLTVEFTEEKGGVVFPRNARGADWPDDAILLMQAHDDSLECRLEASAAGQLEALKGAVARHIDRLAFREAQLRLAGRVRSGETDAGPPQENACPPSPSRSPPPSRR